MFSLQRGSRRWVLRCHCWGSWLKSRWLQWWSGKMEEVFSPVPHVLPCQQCCILSSIVIIIFSPSKITLNLHIDMKITDLLILGEACMMLLEQRCFLFFRQWRPIGLWDVVAPTFSRQSAHRWRWGCRPYSPAALYPQEDSWYSFPLRLSRPQGHSGAGRIRSIGNPMTSLGFELATFRLVA
jgi:hypothetical protein